MMKIGARWPGALVSCSIILLLPSCSGLPRYVRGDLASQGVRAIPAGATFSLHRSLATHPVSGPIESRIVESLRQAGYRETPPAASDFEIWYRLSDGPEDTNRGSSSGFTSRFGPTGEDGLALLSCPDRFSQRLILIATRGNEPNRPPAIVWRAELCSDGGGSEPAVYAARFAGELIRSVGMRRKETRFEFAQTRKPPRLRETRKHPAPATPGPDESPAALPSAPRDAPPPTAPTSPPAPAPHRSAAAPPQTTGTNPPERASSPAPAVPAPPPPAPVGVAAEPAYGRVGPTWARAEQACEALAAEPEVGCTVVVLLSSATPILELGYATREQARLNGPRHTASVGPIFCETATRHGVFDQAFVRIVSPGERAQRPCSQLPR